MISIAPHVGAPSVWGRQSRIRPETQRQDQSLNRQGPNEPGTKSDAVSYLWKGAWQKETARSQLLTKDASRDGNETGCDSLCRSQGGDPVMTMEGELRRHEIVKVRYSGQVPYPLLLNQSHPPLVDLTFALYTLEGEAS